MKGVLNTHLIIRLTVTSSTNPMFIINFFRSYLSTLVNYGGGAWQRNSPKSRLRRTSTSLCGSACSSSSTLFLRFTPS